jgi:hypothetical protein
MISVVYLTATSDEPGCRDLSVLECQVLEAFSIAEAIWLCTQRCASVVVISSSFEDQPELSQLEQHFATIRLGRASSPKDYLRESWSKILMPANE